MKKRTRRRVLHTPASDTDTGIDELSLLGDFGWEITARQIRDALADIERGAPLKIDLDSPGGMWGEGVAIYNLLNRWEGDIEIEVVGEAGSCASFVAMAGDVTVIHEMAGFFVHKPWVLMVGNEDDLEEEAGTLRKLTKVMSDTYMKRYIGSRKDLDELVIGRTGNGTYLSAEEAVDLGFMDAMWESSEGADVEESAKRAARWPKAAWYQRADSRFEKAGDDMKILTQALGEIGVAEPDADELDELNSIMDTLDGLLR